MDTIISITNIRDTIKSILKNKLLIDIEAWDEDFFNQELLGNVIRIQARDLLQLYFEIEKEFNIIIPEEDIELGNFNTVNNIVNIVYKCTQKNDLKIY